MMFRKQKRVPYSQVESDEMILRDHLARDRTVLANERTLLAYIRTAIALLAAGGTLMTVFPGSLPLWFIGVMFLVLGLFVAVFGSWRFAVVARNMRRVGAFSRGEPKEDAAQAAEGDAP